MTVPALVASSPDDIAGLPMEQRGAIITQALEESKSWLAVATKGTDPTPIAEFKAWAATVAEMTRQKGLAEDIQLDALEMVRRAERGIGIAIRNGQEAGEIRKAGQVRGPRRDYLRNGKPVKASEEPDPYRNLISPKSFFDSGQVASETYAMTDVSEEQFEEALEGARDERNLSRANVVRRAQSVGGPPLTRLQKAEKIRELATQGYSSHQMVKQLGTTDTTIREIARSHRIDIPADRVLGKGSKRIDPERVVSQTVYSLEGIRQGLQLLGPEDLDELPPEPIGEWLNSLNESMRCLRDLIKELKNRA